MSENKYANGVTKRPRGPRLKKTSAEITIPQDIRLRALKNYLDNHIIPSVDLEIDICGSLSACVAAWQANDASSILVDLALSSMALAVYARVRSSPQAAAEAYAHYQQLLRLFQEDIARPTLDATSIDARLLTVFLMGRCESTMHRAGDLDLAGSFQKINSWSHHDGAEALLKLWHMHLGHEEASTIVKQTRRGMLKSLLLRGKPIPKWLQDGNRYGEQGAELHYDRILARLVSLRSVMGIQQDVGDETYSDEVMAEAFQLARDLRAFTTDLPEAYIYRRSKTPPSDQDWLSDPMLNVCSTPQHATIWAHLFATRMIVSRTNIQILQSSPETELEAKSCTAMLQEHADNLAATIPQCLGLVYAEGEEVQILPEANMKPWQASRAVWPLTIAVSIPDYDDALRRRFKAQLATIGKIVGDGVLQTVLTDEWPSI